MPTLRPSDFADDEAGPQPESGPRVRLRHRRKKVTDHMLRDEILRHAGGDEPSVFGTERVFSPTYQGSHHERMWILSYLGAFYDDHQITDVLGRAKAGKEATVYCCAAHPDTGLDLIAAKVYRPRQFRNLRNDARYRQGRALLDDRGKVVRDGGMLAAVRKKSEKGKAAVHTSWVEHEYQTLTALYQKGADVPQPVAHGNSTILMEFIGDRYSAAPTLHSLRLERSEAGRLFDRLLHNVEVMLSVGCIHGDLSAYNVLYWDGDVTMIDFPQVVHPRDNAEAQAILERDVVRLCQYFERYGLRRDGRALATSLWERLGPPPEPILDLGDAEEGGPDR